MCCYLTTNFATKGLRTKHGMLLILSLLAGSLSNYARCIKDYFIAQLTWATGIFLSISSTRLCDPDIVIRHWFLKMCGTDVRWMYRLQSHFYILPWRKSSNARRKREQEEFKSFILGLCKDVEEDILWTHTIGGKWNAMYCWKTQKP